MKQLLDRIYARRRLVFAILLACFVLLTLWLTLLGREPGAEREVRLTLFRAYKVWLKGRKRGPSLVKQNIENVLFFVPFGFLLPGTARRARPGIRNFLLTGLVTLLFSAGIEAAQWMFYLGLFELDDIVCNTLGGLIGCGIYALCARRVCKRSNRRTTDGGTT